jgi:ppGpp synthetase/RelA/SpoT-type nucleotidyltranferase
MDWAKPKYKKKQVDWAGSVLLNPFDLKNIDQAIEIIDNFRASHAFPLNTLRHRLSILATNINRKSVIAQRLKRFSSIMAKLRNYESMRLSEMQDIGGCRAVVRTLVDVDNLVAAFMSSHIKHKLSHSDDYINNPKESGYRSYHLVFRYISDKNTTYNGLKIEVQIRTPLQHAWATAVETVDLFTRQALKSSRGMPEWKRFFQLMGTEIAIREHTPPIPGTPSNIKRLRTELAECEKELKIISSLNGFTTALRVTRNPSFKERGNEYFLLALDNIRDRLNITPYKRSELEQAAEDYAKTEEKIRERIGTDAVLVSVDSVRNLRRAYPNYFADTSLFVEILKRAIQNIKITNVHPQQLRLFKKI